MITLVLGGTRSGKSAVAERIAAAEAQRWAGASRQDAVPAAGRTTAPAVTYLATADPDSTDAEHAARIQTHRERRPSSWVTIELTDPADLGRRLGLTAGVVLVDSLGSWLARHHDFVPDPAPLLAGLRARAAPTVLVAEEVGLAVHPQSALGRRYVDALGVLNQQVAAVAGTVLLVVAGRALPVPALDPVQLVADRQDR